MSFIQKIRRYHGRPSPKFQATRLEMVRRFKRKRQLRHEKTAPMTFTFWFRYLDVYGRMRHAEFDVITDMSDLNSIQIGKHITNIMEQIQNKNLPEGAQHFGVYDEFEEVYADNWVVHVGVMEYDLIHAPTP